VELSNVEQHAVWNGVAGRHRLGNPDQDDAETRALQPRLAAAAAIRPGERVLDIGCGTGQSTRQAGRAAAPGRVLGIDLSAGMLARARRLTAEEGLDNVAYEQADAQVHPFAPAGFDLAMSRFGVMFFADPVAAFRNIGRALRPGGRLALMVWQARDRNEWARAIRDALGAEAGADDAVPSPAASAFSLADPATVTGILEEAGFADIGFTDVDEPVYYGRDASAAYEFVHGLWSTTTALAAMAPDAADRARDRLRAAMAAHDTGDGVLFDSRVWIIAARRPPVALPER
jgi:ubiquinone/menaquinone biosynthesis C-methylase UbiE